MVHRYMITGMCAAATARIIIFFGDQSVILHVRYCSDYIVELTIKDSRSKSSSSSVLSTAESIPSGEPLDAMIGKQENCEGLRR